jgi:hypothetical protein
MPIGIAPSTQSLTMTDSPDTLPSLPGSPNNEQTDVEEKSPLYQSLLAVLDMPNSAKPKWLQTVADFDNNPRAVHTSPHNDGALHFVDHNGEVLGIGFPAYLDVHGKYARIGPYFNMATEQGVKVSLYLYSYALLTYCGQRV